MSKYEGAWVQTAPNVWMWDKHLKSGPVTEKNLYYKWSKEHCKAQFNKERKVQSSNVETIQPKQEVGRTRSGRLKVGTVIAFAAYPEKGPRQMMTILEKLEEFGEGGISIGMFWEKLEGQLNTKQDVDRVYKHYHREMVDKGYVRILS